MCCDITRLHPHPHLHGGHVADFWLIAWLRDEDTSCSVPCCLTCGLSLCLNSCSSWLAKWPHAAGSFPSHDSLFFATVGQEGRSPGQKHHGSQGVSPTLNLASLLGGHNPHPHSLCRLLELPSFAFQPSPSSSGRQGPVNEFPTFLDGTYSPTEILWG